MCLTTNAAKTKMAAEEKLKPNHQRFLGQVKLQNPCKSRRFGRIQVRPTCVFDYVKAVRRMKTPYCPFPKLDVEGSNPFARCFITAAIDVT